VILDGYENPLDESGEFDETVSPKEAEAPNSRRVFRALGVGCSVSARTGARLLTRSASANSHMKEIASDEHDYANWPLARQKRLDRFVDVLCQQCADLLRL